MVMFIYNFTTGYIKDHIPYWIWCPEKEITNPREKLIAGFPCLGRSGMIIHNRRQMLN